MGRLEKFKSEIKTGDLVTVLSTQTYFPLCRNNGKWFVPTNSKSHRIKKGEALIVVVDEETLVHADDKHIDDEDALTIHGVIVFASGSACFFGLPRESLCRY